MRKIKIAVFALLAILAIITVVFVIINFVKPKAAGVNIDTNPQATVYVNGEYVGRTPYRTTLSPQEIIVKLIPDSFGTPLVPYETKVALVSGVETVLRRDFSSTSEASSGEIISFEKVGEAETSLAVVTVPDSAQIEVDGQQRGFAPLKIPEITASEHTLTVRADGYKERIMKIRTNQGYKLTAVVMLAKDSVQGTVAEADKPAEIEDGDEVSKVMVEILSTPTGYLRVRKTPSTLAEEVGRVSPGKQYVLLDTDTKTGWYKIEFENDAVTGDEKLKIEGWVTNQYAKKITESESTPALSPQP